MNLLTPMVSLLAQAGNTGEGFWFPESASTIAPDVDFVFDVITGISIFFFVLIVVVMVYFMFKYRRREHVASTEGPTHNTPLEIIWTAIPMILVVVIFYLGLMGYVNVTTPPENSYVINVTAKQWAWTFDYPNGAQESTLYVPVGRPVRLEMNSNDVLHALFIPAFRVKQDLVPGRRTELWFEATREGTFDLFCAEYCGTQHSQMLTQVVAYNQFKFETEITKFANWIDDTPDENLPKAGTRIYNQCSSCHTVDGTKLIGPSFQETFDLFTSGGSRTLADGTQVKVTEEYIRNSILSPRSQLVNTYPSSMTEGLGKQMGNRRVEAMVQMITHLDQVKDADGRLIPFRLEDIVVKTEEPQ